MKVPMIATADVTNAVKWLASDEARYITGITLPIDLGLLAK
jgi:NAD(P)-dependent dehydrogenase (short-subunit alcohol dehydrogenase family)